MERLPFDLGEGTVHVLAPGEDLQALGPKARRAVPPRMAEAWRDVPATLAAWARRAPCEAFAEWLEEAAEARCTLEVYVTRHFPLRAFLAFELAVRQTRGGPMPWIVRIDCLGDGRSASPEPLATVHATIGGLCTQWGASGSLVSPVDLRTRRGWTTFYECDGDELAHDGGGAARWKGHEWGDPAELPRLTLADCVEDLFTCMRGWTAFNMGTQLQLRAEEPGVGR